MWLNSGSAANKGWSTVNYHQSLDFDHPYLSCNDHCDCRLFQEIFFIIYYYFLEILLNNFELVFLEFKDFYKTHRTSFLSFHLFIFLLVILQSFCVLILSPFPYFSTTYRHRMTLFSFYSFFCNHSCLLTLCTFCIFCISSSTKKKT